MIPLSLALALGLSQAPDSGVPLLASCSADDDRIAIAGSADEIEVRQAIAGGDGACYRVELTRGGSKISGYVIGETLPAVAAFVRDRDKSTGPALEAAAQEAAQANARAGQRPFTPETPATLQTFADFSARDLKGRVVSLSGLRARAILVTFWSTRGGASKQELLSVMPVYSQYKNRGLAAIGVNVDGSKHLAEALDDITLPWTQVSDPNGLYRLYGVDPRQGMTFLLDSERRIVASGSIGAMEKKVRELLNPQPPTAP